MTAICRFLFLHDEIIEERKAAPHMMLSEHHPAVTNQLQLCKQCWHRPNQCCLSMSKSGCCLGKPVIYLLA